MGVGSDRYWLVVDGDRIADLLDERAAANDVDGFVKVAHSVDEDRVSWANTIRSIGGHVIFAGADTLIASFECEPVLESLPSLRFGWSGGVGRSFAAAYGALAVAKAMGRMRILLLDGSLVELARTHSAFTN